MDHLATISRDSWSTLICRKCFLPALHQVFFSHKPDLSTLHAALWLAKEIYSRFVSCTSKSDAKLKDFAPSGSDMGNLRYYLWGYFTIFIAFMTGLLLKQSWLMSKLVFRYWTKQSSFYCLIIPIHAFFLHKSGPWWFVKRVHEYAKTNWMRFYSNLTCRQPHWSCDEHIWNQQPITLSALQGSKPPFCFHPFCSCIWSCLAMTDPNSPGPTNMYHPLETLCHKVKNQYQKFSSSVVLPHSKVTSSYIL